MQFIDGMIECLRRRAELDRADFEAETKRAMWALGLEDDELEAEVDAARSASLERRKAATAP